jgi:hypothetical protein
VALLAQEHREDAIAFGGALAADGAERVEIGKWSVHVEIGGQ